MWNEIDVVDLVRRIVALRKHKRIGVVLVEEDRWWVCTSEIDPHGTKERYSLPRLLAHVEAIEDLYGIPRKPPGSVNVSSTAKMVEKA